MKTGFESTILKGQLSGVGTYTLNLLAAMKSLEPEIDLVGFSNGVWSSLGEDRLKQKIARNQNDCGPLGGETGSRMGMMDNLRMRLRKHDHFRRVWRVAQEMSFRHGFPRQAIDIYHAFAALFTLPWRCDAVTLDQFHRQNVRSRDRFPIDLLKQPRRRQMPHIRSRNMDRRELGV